MTRTSGGRDYGGVSAADRRADRRRRLLAAGRQLWGTAGVTDVTVRGVCSAAGLIPRYFYEQFPNREALLFAISDDVRDELLATLVDAGVGDPGTLTDKLRSALTALLDLLAVDPQIHRIVTSDLSSVPGLSEHRTHILDLITGLVVQYAPDVLDGEPPPPAELHRGALFVVGGANRIIEDWLADPRESVAEVAAATAELCTAAVANVATGRAARRSEPHPAL